MKTSLRLLLVAVFAVLFAGTASAHYNPQLGRWLSRDPMGEAGGFNLYAYCGNDPVNKHDPLGLFALSEIFGLPGNEARSPGEAQFRKVLQATLIYDLLTYTCYPNEIEAALIKASNTVADSGQGAELAAFYRQKICEWQTASSEYNQKLDAIYNSPRYKIRELWSASWRGTIAATPINALSKSLFAYDFYDGSFDEGNQRSGALDLALWSIPEMGQMRGLTQIERGVMFFERGDSAWNWTP